MTDSYAGDSMPEVEEERRFQIAVQRQREARGWSQGELARRMSDLGWEAFHQTTISRIEKGARPVRLGEARALARIFDSNVSQMIAPTEAQRALAELEEALEGLKRSRMGMWYALNDYVGMTAPLGLALINAEQVPSREWHGSAIQERFEKALKEGKRLIDTSVDGEVRKMAHELFGEDSVAESTIQDSGE